jgi:GxxExxY protein
VVQRIQSQPNGRDGEADRGIFSGIGGKTARKDTKPQESIRVFFHLFKKYFNIGENPMIIENEISRDIVNISLKIHKELGPGLFESVYEFILCHELRELGYHVESQKTIPVIWKGNTLNFGFKADVIVDYQVIIEIKSVETLNPVHFKQLLTYLRLTKMKLGLLINFNEALVKDGIHRVVNGL